MIDNLLWLVKSDNKNSKGFVVAASVGLLIIIFSLGVSNFLFPSSNKKNKKSIPIKELFEFETVKTDITGEIIERSKASASQYTEDLGDGVKLEMIEIPTGIFVMGSAESEDVYSDIYNNEWPQHEVKINSFYIGKYEITQSQYQTIMGNNPSKFKGGDLPVENVTWNDAVEFCKRLSVQTEKTYRLPSEAEWEYACRAGTTTTFSFGENINTSIVNYREKDFYGQPIREKNREKTITVGSLGIANAFGLYDMQGNVWEWCQDIYQRDYNGAPTNGIAWEQETNDRRVLRGGSWAYSKDYCRCSNRVRNKQTHHDDYDGFRVVLSK